MQGTITDYLKIILEQEKLKNKQLEEECQLLFSLLLRKHYRNISESQFCCTMRRKQIPIVNRKYKYDYFIVDENMNVVPSGKRPEVNENSNNSNSNNANIPELKKQRVGEVNETTLDNNSNDAIIIESKLKEEIEEEEDDDDDGDELDQSTPPIIKNEEEQKSDIKIELETSTTN